MRKYKVYFKIYNKNLVTDVTASSIAEAKEIVRDNVNFLKFVTEEDPVKIVSEIEDPIDFLKKMFGI